MKYLVCITRHITESAFITVDAEDENKAIEIARDKRYELDYEIDDNPPYDYDFNAEIGETE